LGEQWKCVGGGACSLCSEGGEAIETEQATCQTDDQTAVMCLFSFSWYCFTNFNN